jgi:hypothetical protein
MRKIHVEGHEPVTIKVRQLRFATILVDDRSRETTA